MIEKGPERLHAHRAADRDHHHRDPCGDRDPDVPEPARQGQGLVHEGERCTPCSSGVQSYATDNNDVYPSNADVTAKTLQTLLTPLAPPADPCFTGDRLVAHEPVRRPAPRLARPGSAERTNQLPVGLTAVHFHPGRRNQRCVSVSLHSRDAERDGASPDGSRT